MPYVKIAIRKLGSRFQAFVKPSFCANGSPV